VVSNSNLPNYPAKGVRNVATMAAGITGVSRLDPARRERIVTFEVNSMPASRLWRAVKRGGTFDYGRESAKVDSGLLVETLVRTIKLFRRSSGPKFNKNGHPEPEWKRYTQRRGGQLGANVRIADDAMTA